jgi:hypothetical protein
MDGREAMRWFSLGISRPIWDNRIGLYTIVLPVPYVRRLQGLTARKPRVERLRKCRRVCG